MRNHWTEIEKYLEDQKIAQELIGELRDFHMRYDCLLYTSTESSHPLLYYKASQRFILSSGFSGGNASGGGGLIYDFT